MIMIHDSRLPQVYLEGIKSIYPELELFSFDEKCFKTRSKVYGSIRFHPDIFFFPMDKRTLIYSPGLDIEMLSPIRDKGITLVEGETEPLGQYPATCSYNVLKIGQTLFHNLEYTDPGILKKSIEFGYRTFHVNQGYTRCSSLVVSERAMITSDPGIEKTVKRQGFDVLLVSPGDVVLPMEKYGFLGGCGVLFPDGTLMVAGDLTRHKDYGKIRKFIEKSGFAIRDITGQNIFDSGGFILF